ncbi:glycosyltransferase family 4 protein [Polaribacter glomeratus]|uniref:Glycosyl transferase family 1 n=1 Tax=Polaribacter glomeratus TaxID=102 RepID=A0A2S7WUE4_9FLAO|nr:glycosyltransferase family 4 protein [Polaribacter glomeratus]PQJ81205.1 glycosyl transferase family 1 [Polaribacter glomeratus]TXD65762.1 glycosyltransferase family 4 protein [Polaribacter glomeratus]
MKVLIITYYWPPAGGSGVQRWLKFVKYLQNFDVEPIVYTVDNAKYPKEDKTLLDEVSPAIKILKQPIWEPTDLFFWKKKEAQKSDVSNAVNNGFLSFIRGNFFIPDPKIFWVNSSVTFLHQYLKENKVDVVISTGPPHSMHLIAQKLKQKHNIKWIADFRDPWSNLYYNEEFKQLSFAKKQHEKLENLVFKNADCILTVSNSLKKDFDKKATRVEVITNGFDDEVLTEASITLDKKFSISYIGLLPKQSNPKLLFKVLKSLCFENTDFKNDLKLNFIGDISADVKQEITLNNLEGNTDFIGYVSHREAIEFQKKAQVLLLLIPNVEKSEGILTGKLFEYLTAKRPILAMGPETGDLSEILKDTNAGIVIGFDNEVKLTREIRNLYQQYKTGNLQVNSKNIEQFHRKELTKRLSEIIKNL